MYLIIGMLINRYGRGIQSVPELIPNHSFWADFPFLVKVNERVNYTLEFFLRVCDHLYIESGDHSSMPRIKILWFEETILVWLPPLIQE